MTDFAITVAILLVAAVAVLGAAQLILRWSDQRHVDRLTDEWRRRARERRAHESERAEEARRNA